jgi:putative NADH-flavin reductase
VLLVEVTQVTAMALLLVIGASRGIGLETVKRALADGHHVRALARSALTILVDQPELEKIPGDALSSASVLRAVSGVDAVIQALGESKGPQALLCGTTLFSKATRVLIDAMHATSVTRLLAVTGLGAGNSRGHAGFLYDAIVFPLLLNRIYDDKDVQEQMIKASGLDWTIIRPGILTNGPATGKTRALTEPKDWRAGSISRADVADFLVRETFERRFVGETPLLIG